MKSVEKWLIGVAASVGAAAICGYVGVKIVAGVGNPFYVADFCLRDTLFIGTGLCLAMAAYFMWGVWYTLKEKEDKTEAEGG